MSNACRSVDHPGWLALREELWPHCTREEHLVEMAAFLREPERFAQFVECDASDTPVGLLEMSLRRDYVNGTESTPVAFVEGIYVIPQARRKGVARSLVIEAERWARSRGCKELASDAPVENTGSHEMHAALGFTETERVVFFRKALVE